MMLIKTKRVWRQAIISALILVLVGITAVSQADLRTLKGVLYKRCVAAKPSNDRANLLRQHEAGAFASFEAQEERNRFIDDELRRQRIMTWEGLRQDAQSAADSYKPVNCDIYR